jgi:hypothetical protein
MAMGGALTGRVRPLGPLLPTIAEELACVHGVPATRAVQGLKGGESMPRGDKSSYTDKQKRQAEHIEDGYESRGVDPKEAERRAWAL